MKPSGGGHFPLPGASLLSPSSPPLSSPSLFSNFHDRQEPRSQQPPARQCHPLALLFSFFQRKQQEAAATSESRSLPVSPRLFFLFSLPLFSTFFSPSPAALRQAARQRRRSSRPWTAAPTGGEDIDQQPHQRVAAAPGRATMKQTTSSNNG